MNLHQIIPHARETNKTHISSNTGFPVFNERLETEAVAAAVPEHFNYFDLRRVSGPDRRRQHNVMRAFNVTRWLSQRRERQRRQNQNCE
jgi:hypothetical protein